MLQLINVGTTTNYNLQTKLRTTINCKLSDWTYFWNKCSNLSFLAICRSQFPFLIFRASSWLQKAKIALRMNLRNKKNMINHHFKKLYKTICYKAKYKFSQFFFSHWLLYECFFSFFIKDWKYFIGKLSLYIKMEKTWKYW